MKHTRKHMIPSRNLTKRHIYSRIRNTSAIFWNHSRVTVQTVAKWFKKRHSGIFCTFTTSLKFFSTTASAKRSVSMKSKSVKNMGSIGGRFAATACILASALILTACGGGGGSATDLVVTPPVIVAPPVVLVFSCWNGTILSGTVQPTKVGCAAVPDTAVKAVITGTTLSFSGIPTNATLASSTVTAQSGGSVVTWSNGTITSGAMLFSTTYSFIGGKLTFSNAPDLTIAGSFTTGANPAASTCNSTTQKYESGVGACVNQPAIKVLKLNKLPVECQLNLDACYNQKVADGTIQFAQSEISDLVFALYITFDDFVVAYPVHKSDGTPQNVARDIRNGGQKGNPIDWFAGSKNGVTFKGSKDGICVELALNANKTAFATTPVTCPN